MQKRSILLLLIFTLLVSSVWGVVAQGDEIPREAAITAASARLGSRPQSWKYDVLAQTSDSSLGCPLAPKGDLGRLVIPYRYELLYGDGNYVVYVSSDGTVVVLCDSKFDALPSPATPVPASTASTTTTNPPVVSSSCTLVSTGAFTNVRETPSISGRQVGQIFSGTSYAIGAKNSNTADVWYFIAGGWVSAVAVTTAGDCTTVTVNDSFVGNGAGLTQPSTDVSVAQALQTYACPATFEGYLTPRIKAGSQTAQVESGGIPNTLRSQPIVNDQVGARLGTIQPSRVLDRVINGPACSGGYVWWLVEFDGQQGWTVESDFATQEYYLEPTAGNAVTSSTTGTISTNTVTTPDNVVFAVMQQRDDTTSPNWVAFSADNAFLLASDTIVSGDSITNVVVEYDVVSVSATEAGFATAGSITRLQTLTDGRIAVGDASGAITLFQKDATAYQQVSVTQDILDEQTAQGTFVLSDDGAFVAYFACPQAEYGETGQCLASALTLRALDSDEPVWQVALASSHQPFKVLFSPDQQSIVSFGFDGAYIFDRVTGIQLGFISNSTDTYGMLDIAFNPTNPAQVLTSICKDSQAGVGCVQGELTLWDLASNQAVGVVEATTANPLKVAYTPDSAFIIVGDANGNVVVRDGANGQLVTTLVIPQSPETLISITQLAVSADGTLIAVSASDGKLYTWNISALATP
jgi:WD40 repeat protein